MAILLAAFALLAMDAEAEPFKLFGTREIESSTLKHFPKWLNVVTRDPGQREKMKQQCAVGSPNCQYKRWMALVDKARTIESFPDRLAYINRELNKADYILDIVNWGMEDYWETPYEFLMRDGDCEDYAIIKYMTLKMLGVDDNTMRIVVLQDTNLRQLHSVLAVRRDGINYILDNQVAPVIPDASIYHYIPIYSINEHKWWRHIPY